MNCNPSSVDIFQSPAWFDLLLRWGFERKPYWTEQVLIPHGEGGDGGYLPLMQVTPASPIQGVSNYYSPLYGPMSAHKVSAAASDFARVAHAIQRLPGAAVVMLQPLSAQDPFVDALEAGLKKAGYRTDRFFCFGNWYESTEGQTFAKYWARRPSRLRHTVERARRRLNREHDWRVDIVDMSGPALESGIAAYEAVYAQSWKEPEPCPAFMPELMRMAAAQGVLRLGLMWVDGVVVAAQVWLVSAGKASIYKLAYASGAERLSAGSVLTTALMQHVMEVDLVTEVDYLMGDDAYKRDWMSSRRERVGLVAFDLSRVRGLTAWTKHHVGRWVRRHVG